MSGPVHSHPIPPPLPAEAGKPDGQFRKVARGIGRGLDAVFGFAATVVFLAIVSAVPVLNLFSLGFMLECSARIARSGRIRDGFVGVRTFAAAGRIAFGIWLWSLPLRLLYNVWQDAEWIDPGGPRAEDLRILLAVVGTLVALHVTWACIRGGRLRHFLWPAPIAAIRWLGRPHPIRPILDRLLARVRSIDLLHYFRTGLLGFVAAAVWLALPVLVLFAASATEKDGPAVLLSLLGGLLLGTVAIFLPFLQTRVAITQKFRDCLKIRYLRNLFTRAPIAFWLALIVTLLFALPLYLLKIELTPREVAWLPNLVFVLFLLPARFLTGWAVSRAERRDEPRIWISRWFGRLAAIPVVAAYVLVVWLAQYLSWHGSLSLLEQHAFLVPAPLFGL